MQVSNNIIEQPFFSICIPQYNRISFLIEACKVLSQQTFKCFEVCISDDKSTDWREQELIEYLQSAGLSFVYHKQKKNLRYDGNIRASIALARGRYCFLHGNDDCLESNTTLEKLYNKLQKYKFADVVITNYEDWETGKKTWRIKQSQWVGSGPEVAVKHFRNVSFVTGVLIDRVKAQRYSTNKWDGSEMYQMFVAARILASGGSLLELDNSIVRKDIQIRNESVDRHSTKPILVPCPIVERKPPFVKIGRLVADAVEPYLNSPDKNNNLDKIFIQLYLFTYPFWIIEYRRVQSWKYALGICMGIKPSNVLPELNLGKLRTLRLWLLYFLVCTIGLIIPIGVFDRAKPLLYPFSKYAFSK